MKNKMELEGSKCPRIQAPFFEASRVGQSTAGFSKNQTPTGLRAEKNCRHHLIK